MDMAHFFLFIFVISYIVQAESSSTVIRAKALIYKAIPKDVPSENIGMIEFFQNGTETKIIGYVSINAGLHGFHIHEKGDMSDGCNAAGSHFNPHHLLHGGPTDTIRHVGDLGNIEGNKSGITNISITDSLVSLEGMHTVIGRSVVIHENADDFGKGDTDASSKTGNAGGRIACGIIGLVNELEEKVNERENTNYAQEKIVATLIFIQLLSNMI